MTIITREHEPINLLHEDEDNSLIIRRIIKKEKVEITGEEEILIKSWKEIELIPVIRGSDLSWLSQSNQRLANIWFEEHPEKIIA